MSVFILERPCKEKKAGKKSKGREKHSRKNYSHTYFARNRHTKGAFENEFSK